MNQVQEILFKLSQQFNSPISNLILELSEVITNNSNIGYKQLLNLPDWPVAVEPELICDLTSIEDQKERARNIIILTINESLKDKKFLDFGCGDGYTIDAAVGMGATESYGFDIEPSAHWKNENITNNIDIIQQKSPYDIIFLYDVLDHCDNPFEILKTCKSMLNNNGTIYCRTHPFCSRHGGHLYNQINKAFIHIILTEEELAKEGITLQKIQQVKYPAATYEDLFKKSNLKVVYKYTDKTPVEKFFKNNEEISNRIKAFIGSKIFPHIQLEQNFLTYKLKHEIPS